MSIYLINHLRMPNASPKPANLEHLEPVAPDLTSAARAGQLRTALADSAP